MKETMYDKKFVYKHWKFLVFLVLLLFGSSWVSRFSPAWPQTHFVDLAYSFLHGQLDLRFSGELNDLAYFGGKYYVPFGPIPGVILMPFVALFGLNFPQQFLAYACLLTNFFLLYRICKAAGMKNDSNALWLVLFFLFGTIYLSLTLINISAYLVQVVGITFVILGLDEYFHKKRWFLIGVYLGFATATRPILCLSVAFFFFEMLIHAKDTWKNYYTLLLLIMPLFISIIFLGGYNYARFGTMFDNGYDHNISHGEDLINAREKGFFSLAHVPGNIYLFLFKSPDPVYENDVNYVLKMPYLKVDPWGLGIFFTSPLFLYLILADPKKKHIVSSLLAAVILLIPTVTYYAYGVWQYGYRHALDFYPFLFIMLISIFKDHLPLRAKLFICYGMIFNFFYMFSIWNVYPF